MIRPAPSPKLLRVGLVTEEELQKPDSDYPTSVEYTRNRMRARHHVKSFKERDMEEKFVMKGLESRMAY
jgi:hypothetical protein